MRAGYLAIVIVMRAGYPSGSDGGGRVGCPSGSNSDGGRVFLVVVAVIGVIVIGYPSGS